MNDLPTSVFQLPEGLDEEALKDYLHKMVAEQRARLDAARPEYVWWADVVFFLKDINGICSILNANGDTSIADALIKVVDTTATELTMHLVGGDEAAARKLANELSAEVEILEGVMGQAMMKFNGGKEQ